VADGVGGWRHYGIDPGEFSAFLMRTCERLVCSGRFITTEPAGLLARSYYELLESKQPILGADRLILILNVVRVFISVLNPLAPEGGYNCHSF
jgi:protein phosphatase PTC7